MQVFAIIKSHSGLLQVGHFSSKYISKVYL